MFKLSRFLFFATNFILIMCIIFCDELVSHLYRIWLINLPIKENNGINRRFLSPYLNLK